jgi:hypothetical protein
LPPLSVPGIAFVGMGMPTYTGIARKPKP